MRSRKAGYWPVLALAVGLFWAGPLCGQGSEMLDLVNTLTIQHPGIEDVAGLGGLTYSDGSLWMGYAYAGYSLYDGESGEFGSDVAWVGQVDPANGAILAEYPILGSDWPYAPVTGLAGSGSKMYAAVRSESASGIAEFTPGSATQGFHGFEGPEPAVRATGLAHDGSLLWQAHYSPQVGHLYALNTSTGQRVNDLSLDAYPYGLAWDGRYFYASHHDPYGQYSYIAQYDRSGAKVATLELPSSLVRSPIGDLAVNGQDLYAHVLGTNTIAHLALPAAVSTPPLPPGLVNQATIVNAALTYDSGVETDTRTAANFEQLPVAATLRRTVVDFEADVLATARSYSDGEKVHNTLHAMAYGGDYTSDLVGTATLVADKSMLIAPTASLPAGTRVNAKGTMTLNGLIQALNVGDASGTGAFLDVEILRTSPGSELPIFSGAIWLVGTSGNGAWANLLVDGDFVGTPIEQALQSALTVEETVATLPLDHLAFEFGVPAVVGQSFEVTISILGAAAVPAGGNAGMEIALGEAPVLLPNYQPPLDPESYNDNFLGEWSWDPGLYVPEPAALVLLAAGATCLQRRRGRAS